MHNKQLATEAFARVLEMNPNAEDLQVPADEFLLEYGTLLLETGRSRNALQHLKHSVSLRSTAQGHALIGKAHLQLGRPELAKEAWLRAVTEESSNQVAREALAQYALQQSSAQEAIQWLLPLTSAETSQSSTAYLLQRAYLILHDSKKSDFWRKRAAVLRKKELLKATVDHVLAESPQSFWARVIRAYRLAEEGNWQQAAVLASALSREAPTEPFLRDLNKAIQKRAALPSLEQLPIKQF